MYTEGLHFCTPAVYTLTIPPHAGPRKPNPLIIKAPRGLFRGAQLLSGEAGVGFEPTNDGFANRCLRPLGYPADV